MATPWLELKQDSFAGGMNTTEDKRRLQETEVQLIENMLLDRNGVLYIPKADSPYATTPALKGVLGLWRHYPESTLDNRLIVVAGGSIYTGNDASGVLTTALANWQTGTKPARFFSQRYYSYIMDGQDAIRAIGPMSEGWIDPIPAGPTSTLWFYGGYSGGNILGTVQYKITNVNAVGESSVGPLFTNSFPGYTGDPYVWCNNQFVNIFGLTPKSGNNYTYIYRSNPPSTDVAAEFKLIKKTQASVFSDNTFIGSELPGSVYVENLYSSTAKFGTEWRDRVFWAKGNTIYVSDAFVPTAVKLIVNVGGSGEIQGLAPMAQMLVIFKPTSIYALTGYDEDDFGTQIYTEQFGLSAPRSLVEFENNAWWVGDDKVFTVDASGQITNVGKQIESILEAFPRDRLETHVVGVYHDGYYYLSLDDNVAPKTYAYSVALNAWTSLDGAYSAFARLAPPGDIDFSGKLSAFMAGEADGDVQQVQGATTWRTVAKVVSRQMDAGIPYQDKLYRSVRLDATPSAFATVDAFFTSGERNALLVAVPVSDPTRRLLPRTFQGESVETVIVIDNDGGEFKFRGFMVEAAPRPLR